MTFGRNVQDSRIVYACFSFHAGLLLSAFHLSNEPDTENNVNLDAVSSKHGNFDEVQYFFKTFT